MSKMVNENNEKFDFEAYKKAGEERAFKLEN